MVVVGYANFIFLEKLYPMNPKIWVKRMLTSVGCPRPNVAPLSLLPPPPPKEGR